MQYFYDAQIRRFIIQFQKLFSLFYVTKGVDPNGNQILQRVPIVYGDQSRNVATIIANNTPSNLPSTPLFSTYITGLEYDQTRTQNPTFVDKMEVRQRLYDEATETYDTIQGQAFTVERLMPVPYTLRMQVDFWSTNTQQKLEIFEQIGCLYNPSLEIQSNDNFIDWTSLSVVYQERLTWSSRSVPVGTSNPLDIMSWSFYMPIWISAPAKLKKMGVIHKIINSIHKGSILEDIQDDELLLGTRQKISPYGYKLLLIGNTLQVLPEDTAFSPSNQNLALPENPDTAVYWSAYLNMYGTVRPGISQIWLQNPYMDTDIVGTIDFNPDDDRLLIYNIDTSTLPQNTLASVNAVIDPLKSGPNAGLPGAVNGQRYLILDDIGHDNHELRIPGDLLGGTSPANDIVFRVKSLAGNGGIVEIDEPTISGRSVASMTTRVFSQLPIFAVRGSGQLAYCDVTVDANTQYYSIRNTVIAITNPGQGYMLSDPTVSWGNLVAKANDIVEYDSLQGEWVVSFDSNLATENSQVEFVTNLNTNVQYRFVPSEGWMKSWEGWYGSGDFNIII